MLIASLILIRLLLLLTIGHRMLWVALLLVVPLRGRVLLCRIILRLRRLLAHEGLGHRWELLSEGRRCLGKGLGMI